MSSPNLIEIERLTVRFGASTVVDDVSFAIRPGEKFALVGESGSGKSITALSVLRLVEAATTTGAIRFDGVDLLLKSEREMRGIRGADIAMIFQEPMTAMNPLYTVGNQIGEVLELHEALRPNAARARAIELLAQTGIPEPERRVNDYPFQMSGGQKQRVMIAIALAAEPDVVIADEPTTALDVTIQAQILALMRGLQQETGAAIILITHDLGVVAEVADEVLVMYAGRVVERAPVQTLFEAPQHPYTIGLLGSIPRLDGQLDRLASIEGQVPSPLRRPAGCSFAERCPFADAHCHAQAPALRQVGTDHFSACWKAPLDPQLLMANWPEAA